MNALSYEMKYESSFHPIFASALAAPIDIYRTNRRWDLRSNITQSKEIINTQPWECNCRQSCLLYIKSAYQLARGKRSHIDNIFRILLRLSIRIEMVHRCTRQSHHSYHQNHSWGGHTTAWTLQNAKRVKKFHERINSQRFCGTKIRMMEMKGGYSSTIQLSVEMSTTRPPNWWASWVKAWRCWCLCRSASDGARIRGWNGPSWILVPCSLE